MDILNELEYAEKLLKDGFSNYMAFNDFKVLSKYYRYCGRKEKEIEGLILDFCERFAPNFVEHLFIRSIQAAIRQGKKYNLRLPKDVPITKNEIEKIKELHNYRLEKVLFVMLALSKYNKLTNTGKTESNSKGYFVPDQKKKFLRLAHVTEKQGENIFNQLYNLGYYEILDWSGSYFLKYCYGDDNSEIYTIVTNMNDILSFFVPYCEICGKDIEKTGKNQKICEDCRKNVVKNQTKKRVENFRNKM